MAWFRGARRKTPSASAGRMARLLPLSPATSPWPSWKTWRRSPRAGRRGCSGERRNASQREAGTMSASTYSAIAFITEGSDFSIPAAADRLRSCRGLLGVVVQTISAKELDLLFDGWRLRVAIDDGEYVSAEGQDAA